MRLVSAWQSWQWILGWRRWILQPKPLVLASTEKDILDESVYVSMLNMPWFGEINPSYILEGDWDVVGHGANIFGYFSTTCEWLS